MPDQATNRELIREALREGYKDVIEAGELC
jgi:hypothetical protein